jgi:hypothetical protein
MRGGRRGRCGRTEQFLWATKMRLLDGSGARRPNDVTTPGSSRAWPGLGDAVMQ